jgi:GNS1/SUR4 family
MRELGLSNLTSTEAWTVDLDHDFWTSFSVGVFEQFRWYFAAAAILYIPCVFGGIKLMQSREPFEMKRLLTVWNFIMASYSAWGSVVTMLPVIVFAATRMQHPLDLVCDFWCYQQPLVNQLTVFSFLVSKLFEFIDTVFLVLRKRPVIFLHWYHHVITYLFTWYANLTTQHHNCAGYYFCSMNFSVHAFMYTYYMLRSLEIRPKWDLYITIMQLGQMVLGVVILFMSMLCETTDWTGVFFGLCLYASFFYLFVKIFQRRYLTPEGFRSTASAVAATTDKKNN